MVMNTEHTSISCPHCGQQARGDAAFCVRCGARLDSPPPPDRGRLSPSRLLLRLALLWYVLALVVVASLWSGGVVGTHFPDRLEAYNNLVLLFDLACIPFFLLLRQALIIRRLRDLDAGPWWSFLLWPPLLPLLLALLPGTRGPNRYGPRPPALSPASLLAFPAILLGAFLIMVSVNLAEVWYEAQETRRLDQSAQEILQYELLAETYRSLSGRQIKSLEELYPEITGERPHLADPWGEPYQIHAESNRPVQIVSPRADAVRLRKLSQLYLRD